MSTRVWGRQEVMFGRMNILQYSIDNYCNENNKRRHQEIPGSNPGRVSMTRWPNGKTPDYGCIPF